MAELADAHGSGPCGSNAMQVQVLSSALCGMVITLLECCYHFVLLCALFCAGQFRYFCVVADGLHVNIDYALILYAYISKGVDESMLKLRVHELLKERNKTPYWLNKQLGMSFQNFNNMIDNKTSSIQYKNIETMCIIFNVTPNELFDFDFNKSE